LNWCSFGVVLDVDIIRMV